MGSSLVKKKKKSLTVRPEWSQLVLTEWLYSLVHFYVCVNRKSKQLQDIKRHDGLDRNRMLTGL
jgi:hypothetical protein